MSNCTKGDFVEEAAVTGLYRNSDQLQVRPVGIGQQH